MASFVVMVAALLAGCGLRNTGPVTPPPSAALASCAVSASPVDTKLVLAGAPDQAALDIIAAHQGGPLRLQVPADLPFRHVAALAAEASGSVLLFDVELLGADGTIWTLPLELGDLTATPWDGSLDAVSTPATLPSETLLGVMGSPEEASTADAAVTVLIDVDAAWADAGGQRRSTAAAGLADAVGALIVNAEHPVAFLDATSNTPWETVVVGLAALACGEEPGVVLLGR